MRIRHLRNTPLPDTGDSTRVQPSDWNADHVCDVDIITENTTFVVDPTGNNASFSTLAECFAHVNGLIFKPDVKLEISLSAGIHPVNANVVDTNAHRLIRIKGQAPVALTVTAASVSGAAGTRQVAYTVNGTIPSSVVAGTVLVFHNAGAADAGKMGHFGAHVILDVTGQVITVLNTNVGAVDAFSAQSVTGVHVLTTVIRANSSVTSVLSVTGANKGDYNTPYLENLAINGAGVSGFGFRARHGSKVACTGAASQYSVALVNSSINMLAEDSSSIMWGNSGVVVSSSMTGVLSARASLIDLANYSIISSSSDSGVASTITGNAIAYSTISVDSNYAAKATQLGRIAWSVLSYRSVAAQTQADGTSFIG